MKENNFTKNNSHLECTPKNCKECDNYEIGKCKQYFCQYTKQIVFPEKNTKPNNCPF